MLGDVNHSTHWRNPETGIHSNDAESEWARLKLFLRAKYSYARGPGRGGPKAEGVQEENVELNVAEYLYYTNVGRKWRRS